MSFKEIEVFVVVDGYSYEGKHDVLYTRDKKEAIDEAEKLAEKDSVSHDRNDSYSDSIVTFEESGLGSYFSVRKRTMKFGKGFENLEEVEEQE